MNKKVWSILLLSIYFIGIFARYEIVDNSVEFRELLDESDFSFVCFADGASQQSRIIKEAMRTLAYLGEFGGILRDRLSFIFVSANHYKVAKLAQKMGYKNEPVFMLFESDQLLSKTDLDNNYSVENMKQFIENVIFDSLQELKFDVREKKKAERRDETYDPIIVVKMMIDNRVYPRRAGYYWNECPYWWYKRYYRPSIQERIMEVRNEM